MVTMDCCLDSGSLYSIRLSIIGGDGRIQNVVNDECELMVMAQIRDG